VSKGCVEGSSVGKQRVVPGSFVGGGRYLTQQFQDVVAICRVYGCRYIRLKVPPARVSNLKGARLSVTLP
jgi:hypothetical protein